MKVIKKVWNGRDHVRVLTDTGIRVRVPAYFGVEGTELDENRIFPCINGPDYEYVKPTSRRYKWSVAERNSTNIKVEDWNEFIELSKRYIRAFVKIGWLKPHQFDEAYEGWLGRAYKSGVHYRMSLMDPEHRRRYMYSSVKGDLVDEFKNRVIENQTVSFEELESLGVA